MAQPQSVLSSEVSLYRHSINREECVIIERVIWLATHAYNKYYVLQLRELAMTVAVELRMTAITGVLELRSGLNPSGQLVVSLTKLS